MILINTAYHQIKPPIYANILFELQVTHKLSYQKFKNFYRILNQNADENLVNESAKKAFKEADTDKDGSIGFDEFAAYYMLQYCRAKYPEEKKEIEEETQFDVMY